MTSFPQPDLNRASKEPCGECRLRPGETCDICGAASIAVSEEPIQSLDTPPATDGYVLAPREPTEAMIDAAEEEMASKRGFGMRIYAADVWESMIKAIEAR